jgi:hypothetical protein
MDHNIVGLQVEVVRTGRYGECMGGPQSNVYNPTLGLHSGTFLHLENPTEEP